MLIIDQTRANETQQAVVVAARVGGRSLPIAWRVKETEGAIGFPEQNAALEAVLKLLPPNARVVLMGDRFYGSPNLIAWAGAHGWDWRLRLKADLLVFEDGGESTIAECFSRGERMLTGVEVTAKRVATNIGMVHEDGQRTFIVSDKRSLTRSRGSSPCPMRRPLQKHSTTDCVGASRRCSPTSRAAASVSKTASCNAQTAWTV